jgi:hypothetical protein
MGREKGVLFFLQEGESSCSRWRKRWGWNEDISSAPVCSNATSFLHDLDRPFTFKGHDELPPRIFTVRDSKEQLPYKISRHLFPMNLQAQNTPFANSPESRLWLGVPNWTRAAAIPACAVRSLPPRMLLLISMHRVRRRCTSI